MAKDYSEYKYDSYERYWLERSNRSTVKLNYYMNFARFDPSQKEVRISVDFTKEFDYMDEAIKKDRELSGWVLDPEREAKELEDRRAEEIPENQKWRDHFIKKYGFTFEQEEYEELMSRISENMIALETPEPRINVLSGKAIEFNYGEGILDFIYADFTSSLRKVYTAQKQFELFLEALGTAAKKKTDTLPDHQTEKVEKIVSHIQDEVAEFYLFHSTFDNIKELLYASAYTTICPPVFKKEMKFSQELKWYGNYILRLQKEYLELIEFCYDENCHPDTLKKLHPVERYNLYRFLKHQPSTSTREERVMTASNVSSPGGFPYGASEKTIFDRLTGKPVVTEDIEKMASEYGTDPMMIAGFLMRPRFLNIRYTFGAVHEILQLEFTKMLEANVRFRKCKRCGRYFIMKGNYDTNYCDYVADGETRNCQELAAQENYKKKTAEDPAIPLYQKYYKRYAARVRVRQIKEQDFKRWKYEAMTKRNECSAGRMTVEDYTAWLEASFAKRKADHDEPQ